MTGPHQRLHLIVHGRVQGVFYRASTRDQARQLLLSGWVKNLPDGGVEIVAEGQESALFEFLRWCRKGPPAARVEDVETQWAEASSEFEGFHVRY